MNDDVCRSGIMGIYPGLDGGVAVILSDHADVRVTPTLPGGKGTRRKYDVAGMVALLTQHPIELAAIEEVGPMLEQGVSSMFRFGMGYGLWLGLLAGLRIPHVVVKPHLWKRAVLASTAQNKAATVEFAARRFPNVSLLPGPRYKVPHDGLADALALAEYARRVVDTRGDVPEAPARAIH